MTVAALIAMLIAWVFIFIMAFCISVDQYETKSKIITWVVAILIAAGMFIGIRWYFSSTASGQRLLTDQQSDFSNGLNRIVIVYTADGTEMARYEGRIDLEANNDYVKFDFEGKRYIYYNCFVESIADIP